MTVSLLGESVNSEILDSIAKPLALFLERVPAGFPSPAQDYIEQRLDLTNFALTTLRLLILCVVRVIQ